MVVGGICIGGSLGFASDLVYLRCHEKLATVSESIKKVEAKSEAELIDYLRNNSTKKALHKQVSDEDIKKAFR